MDWGAKQNMIQYGQPTPPPYNLSSVTAPVVVFYGDNDWLATPKVISFFIIYHELLILCNESSLNYQ